MDDGGPLNSNGTQQEHKKKAQTTIIVVWAWVFYLPPYNSTNSSFPKHVFS